MNIIKDSYLLPWNEKDNPNGWIEPTTFCQLKCPGCYRGLDKDNCAHVHEDFLKLTKQIDDFVVNRNIQTLSIAGGEPLLYPKINELVNYAHQQGLEVIIYTNGLLLDEEKLRSLKYNGASQFFLHIDKFQNRNTYINETDLLKLREKYCNMFRKVGGVNLGFIQPISKNNLTDVNLLVDFYNKNIDIVNFVAFSLYSDVCWDQKTKLNIDTGIDMEDIVNEIRRKYEFEVCAYLGSTKNISNPTWLFSTKVGTNDYQFGCLDGKMFKFIQTNHHKKTGKYLFVTKDNKINILKLFVGLGGRSISRIIVNYLKKKMVAPINLGSTVYFQTTLILRGPKQLTGEWDLCQGCPDAIFFQDKLVPSCILEVIKGLSPNT